jgi:hypothetical protein
LRAGTVSGVKGLLKRGSELLDTAKVGDENTTQKVITTEKEPRELDQKKNSKEELKNL